MVVRARAGIFNVIADEAVALFPLIARPKEQIEVWRQAVSEGLSLISEDDFSMIVEPPELTSRDKKDGFVGVCLFYGFGHKPHPYESDPQFVGFLSDPILSGGIPWQFYLSRNPSIPSGGINFDGIACYFLDRWRPWRFYWKKVRFLDLYSDSSGYTPPGFTRSGFPDKKDQCFSSEGVQFFCIIHRDFLKGMGITEPMRFLLSGYDVAERYGLPRKVPLIVINPEGLLTLDVVLKDAVICGHTYVGIARW